MAMAVKPPTSKARLALALVLLAAAIGVLVWRLTGSSQPKIDDETAQKAREIESKIQAAAPKDAGQQPAPIPRTHGAAPMAPPK